MGGDSFVNWWRNPYRMHRVRGLGFIRMNAVVDGWVDRIPIPVQRPPITVDRMARMHLAPRKLSEEVDELVS